MQLGHTRMYTNVLKYTRSILYRQILQCSCPYRSNMEPCLCVTQLCQDLLKLLLVEKISFSTVLSDFKSVSTPLPLHQSI